MIRLRYSQRNALTRLTRIFGVLLVIWTTLEVIWIRSAVVQESRTESHSLGNQRIFIASIHWTDEIVLKTHWIRAVVDLAKAIGPENVFVSIHESGSLDDTKGALGYLEYELQQAGIPRSIMLDYTERIDVVEAPPAETGWMTMPVDKVVPATPSTSATIPKGKPVPRRIPYLAELRNIVLRPLYKLRDEEGKKFDKILFLNDVVFDTDDFFNLLHTRNGDYGTACAMDFKRPPAMYDTFALRDTEGYEPIMDNWPYFRAHESREALLKGQPVPVSSCWNGMLLMDAAPFYDRADPLQFRGISDSLAKSHLEGSECCLIHTDNPLSYTKGVWVNTNVRVGYTGEAHEEVNPHKRSDWLGSMRIGFGLWHNRILRWLTSTSGIKNRIAKRVETWRKKHPGEEESGTACLIDETQVLIFNGWAHV